MWNTVNKHIREKQKRTLRHAQFAREQKECKKRLGQDYWPLRGRIYEGCSPYSCIAMIGTVVVKFYSFVQLGLSTPPPSVYCRLCPVPSSCHFHHRTQQRGSETLWMSSAPLQPDIGVNLVHVLAWYWRHHPLSHHASHKARYYYSFHYNNNTWGFLVYTFKPIAARAIYF